MAERRTASVPGVAPLAPAQPNAGNRPERHQTERVVVPARAGQLPNWFWGALGCLSVLGVGFTIMLVVGRPAAEAPRPAVVTAPPAAPAAPQGIQVEQLAPPPPPPSPAPVHRAAPRPVKVARLPAAAPAAAAQPAADDDAAVEAAFGITADPDQKGDSPKPEARKASNDTKADEGSSDEDEPMPKRKARVQAAAPATDSETPETP
jgi:hypothetical protein